MATSSAESPLARFLRHLRAHTKKDPIPEGAGYKAHCPAHNDGTPSLSVSEGDDGRVLLYCFAGCETESVVDAIGLTMADLFDAPGSKRIVATYTYRDETGTVLYRTVRYAPKDFRAERPVGQGWKDRPPRKMKKQERSYPRIQQGSVLHPEHPDIPLTRTGARGRSGRMQ